MPNQLPIAVLISGGGTTLENLLTVKAQGQLDCEFRLVVSSKQACRGNKIAQDAGVELQKIARRDFSDGQSHSDAVFDHCRRLGVELVVMGGYLDHLLIPEDFTNRVINIHPSLIPAFSGKGYYGMRVHRAVVEYGVKVTGCTAHFVDNQFDHGPIIAQRTCEVTPSDSPEEVQQRVFELERQLFPFILQQIALGRVQVTDRTVTVRST